MKWPEFDAEPAACAGHGEVAAGRGVSPCAGIICCGRRWKHLPKELAALGEQAGCAEEADPRARARRGVGIQGTDSWSGTSINEPVTNTDVQRLLGKGILAETFKAAREADSQARLFINDYGILSHGGADTEHQDAYYPSYPRVT